MKDLKSIIRNKIWGRVWKVFVIVLGVVGALTWFVRAAKSSAARTTTVVTCDYP